MADTVHSQLRPAAGRPVEFCLAMRFDGRFDVRFEVRFEVRFDVRRDGAN
ncbi:hypothetical protein [Achromobacter animicus]|nr:hypothetical protein [Achromobacter animicus]